MPGYRDAYSSPYYVLREDPESGEIKAVRASYAEWAESMMASPESRRVQSDHIVTGSSEPVVTVHVSTVLLPMNPMLDGPLYETLVFGGDLDGTQNRYPTYKEALEGHNEIKEWVKLAEKPKSSEAEEATHEDG